MTPENEVLRLFHNWLPIVSYGDYVYSVGGFERDRLLGNVSKDLDLVIHLRNGAEIFSKHIQSKFPDSVSNPYNLGANYPIWHIVFTDNVIYKDILYCVKGAEIDIADTQKEAYPDPLTRQRITVFGTLEEDCFRRDFTINQIYRNIVTNQVCDISGYAVSDIANKIIRINPVCCPNKIFSDDPLRMLRLIRFAIKYRMKIPLCMIRAVRYNSDRLQIVSAERICDELRKICNNSEQGMYFAVRLMKLMKLLQYVFPEIYNLINVPNREQQKYESREIHLEGDIYTHTLLSLAHTSADFTEQMAVLLHDIGKPAVMVMEDNKIKYRDHNETGAKIAETVLTRLKLDNQFIKTVCFVIFNHMRIHKIEINSLKSIRKYIREMGEYLDLVIKIGIADAAGNLKLVNGQITPDFVPSELLAKIQEVRQSPLLNDTKRKPVLNGYEIMELLKLNPGKEIGKATQILFDLEDEHGEKMTDKNFAKEQLKNKWESICV